jgi:hypothetical protein
MHRIPEDPSSVRGSRWPVPDDFVADLEHWQKAVRSSYLTGMGIDWKTIRNVMDMRAMYGGFAAVLREMKVWVMNAGHAAGDLRPRAVRDLPTTGASPSPPTYPRSYDLLHADHLFSKLKPRYTKQLANLDSRAHASIILTADDIAGHDSTPSLVLFSCIYMHEGVRCCM